MLNVCIRKLPAKAKRRKMQYKSTKTIMNHRSRLNLKPQICNAIKKQKTERKKSSNRAPCKYEKESDEPSIGETVEKERKNEDRSGWSINLLQLVAEKTGRVVVSKEDDEISRV
ncbi:hypothetical protein BJ508DRAFT_50888 [Ascobolus immersus RN42]|uniref:Uncharacterized protein n=1 Tax=Ascobolus immersus RN42 TaxID=1160509 RepID=A0A3N4IE01_ASCIM|nr:hypothetical protein BJ508DRAFT_50888 [Ascobolus immersus RN42]